MTSCDHQNLTLLPRQTSRIRCRHCHLTMKAQELGTGYCPECYETSGAKNYAFDEIDGAKESASRYRCEQCGAIVMTP